jgi:4-hydroxy-4-methyl-2-oxoglutarate aldolase
VKPADLEFLRSVDSPTVANAIERLHPRDRTQGFVGGSVRCLFPSLGPMVARAVTLTMTSRPGPVAARAGYWRMWEAVSAADPGSVLVVQDLSGAPSRCAYVGEVMATMAQRSGCVGFVTDGGVRDLAEVEALGFHLFAAQVVVSHGNFEVVDVGVDVTLDGELIRSGDLLHADRNGIVVVPDAVLAQLPAEVEAIRRSEAEYLAFIGSADFSLAEARRRAGY